jgi:protoporphyrinogen oxidase
MSSTSSTSVAVIGSGFAGLTAAHRLKKAGLHPVVFEALDRPGGRTYSVQRGEFLFDLGTIAPIGGNPITQELVDVAGLGPCFAMAPPMVMGIVRNGRARRIDSAHPLRDFLTTDLYSIASKLRLAGLAREIFSLRKILTNDNAIGLGKLDNMTIPQYAAERFNDEILNYLFSPILRGIWATSAKGHSVVQLLWTLRQLAYPLYSLSTGNGSLPVALAKHHDMRYGHVVENVEYSGNGVRVEYTASGARRTEHFAACIIATPIPVTRSIYPSMTGAEKRFIDQIRFTSIVCVHVALSKRPSNTETALLFPECEFDDVAVVYVNHNKAPGRAPAGKGSLSVYFTQEWSADKLDWPDEKILEIAIARLTPHYGFIQPLIEDAFVYRWPTFIMDATPGLYQLMDEYHCSLVDHPPSRVQLAGDFMPNAGINQAMASGAAAAQRIVAALGQPRQHNCQPHPT